MNQRGYDWHMVAKYLCEYHGVADVAQINPFAQHPVQAWDVMRETAVGVEFEARVEGAPITAMRAGRLLGSAQPRTPFLHPQTQQPLGDTDLERAFIYSITCRHARSTVPATLALRLNYYHESMAALQDTREHDRIMEAAGAVAGAFDVIGKGERDMDSVPLRELPYGYQCAAFVRTMALVCDANLKNGLVTIPADLCIAAGLPVWRGGIEPDPAAVEQLVRSMKLDPQSEQATEVRAQFAEQWREQTEEMHKNGSPILFFCAIPCAHVLAWALHSADFAHQNGLRAELFSYKTSAAAKSVPLYYLVPNVMVDRLAQMLREHWMHKADCRPLASVGFELVAEAPCEGDVSVRAYLKYMSAPPLPAATVANLAPTLSPDFPASGLWAREELASGGEQTLRKKDVQ
jgi:hypothetical protein